MTPNRRPPRKPVIKRAIKTPNNTVVLSGKRTVSAATAKSSKGSTKPEKPKVRGAEVSIRESASPGQIVYGQFKVGGVFSFAAINKPEKAYLRTGEDDSQIVWQAKANGATGNDISVIIEVTGSVGSTTITVTGKQIKVRAKSSGSSSQASANSVIAAIQADTAASALVKVHKGEGTGSSYVQPVTETFLANGGGTILHLVITIAAHKINSIEKIYLDNREVSFKTNGDSTGYFRRTNNLSESLVYRSYALGDDDQLAIQDLVNNLAPKWTDNHRQRGCAHCYLKLKWDEDKFPQGLPRISFKVKGKPVYDPRTATTAYSTNAALIIADYLTNTKWGLGIAYSDIDEAALIDAANVCDENITLSDGSSEKRYRIQGVFDASDQPKQVLDEMADAIAGDIVYQNGTWRILPGKWRTPTQSFSRADVIGPVSVTTRRSRADTYNCVRGTFADDTLDNEVTDFAPIKVSTYITEDGREIYQDLALNWVTSQTQAQRIAKIRLAQIRQPIVVTVSFTLKGLSLQIGDVIQYSDSEFGWSGKHFEVRDLAINESSSGAFAVDVTLCETAEAIYTWTNAEQLAVDPAPNTDFPDYSDLGSVTGLTLASGTEHLYLRADGTVFARLFVSWTASDNEFVVRGGSYEIQSKLSASSVWVPNVIVGSQSTNVYILDVKDGEQYDVRIRAITAVGVKSDWTTVTNYLVIGKTAPPTNVPSLTATIEGFGILLAWESISDIDVQEYELRYGASGATWESLVNTAIRVKANQFFFKTFVAGTHVFHVKAIDTTGNYSVISTTQSFTVAAPGVVGSYSVSQVDNNILVDWDEPTVGTFPISHYNVYRGATFGAATLLGQVGGTFYAYIENTGGSFTYWVTAVDSAGNEGTELGQTVRVASPPDYILIDSRTLTPNSATLTRCLDEGNGSSFLTPVNVTETWEEHFTNNSKTTLQDFIDAGFSVWVQPTPTTAATAEWTYDIGTTLPQNLISVSWLLTGLAGSPSISPKISWRKLTTDSWMDGTAGAQQVFATNFRYVKVVLSTTGTNNLALGQVTNVVVKVDTKKQTDAGTGTVTNATNGAAVTFGLNFLDVMSIVVTPQSTTAVIPVVDFTDVANPTGFTVYLYNTSGTKVTGDFRWTAIGVINNS